MNEFEIGVFGELKSEGESGTSNAGRLSYTEAELPKFVFIMDDAQFEFRRFLLQISEELTKIEFEKLKFVLKGKMRRCEEMKEPFHYFEELQKSLLLTPTRLEVLKDGLDAVGRTDLVKKLEEKEQFFADRFSPQVTDGDNLDQTGL